MLGITICSARKNIPTLSQFSPKNFRHTHKNNAQLILLSNRTPTAVIVIAIAIAITIAIIAVAVIVLIIIIIILMTLSYLIQ
jgi:hypothetical protein